jgi:hypothetical protein
MRLQHAFAKLANKGDDSLVSGVGSFLAAFRVELRRRSSNELATEKHRIYISAIKPEYQ